MFVCFPSSKFDAVRLCVACVFVQLASLGGGFPSSNFCEAGYVNMYCFNLVKSLNILFLHQW